MKGIVPHLWFDKEAKEAVEFYISLFDNSRITSIQELEDTPSGDSITVNFELAGQPFGAINGGPYFTFNPSLSLMVMCETKEEVDEKWQALSKDGKVLMPLEKYPFSDYYGWAEDRYGLSWQLILAEEGDIVQKIVPHFLFSNEMAGKTEEVLAFYTEIFPNSEIGQVYKYGPEELENPDADVTFADFRLNGMEFNAMDNAYKADFTFNEAFSLLVLCESQEEIDYYWDNLSAVPEAEECGWLKDKYGVSWQIASERMNELFENGTREQINRVTQAFLKMKKLDMEELEKAWNSEE